MKSDSHLDRGDSNVDNSSKKFILRYVDLCRLQLILYGPSPVGFVSIDFALWLEWKLLESLLASHISISAL